MTPEPLTRYYTVNDVAHILGVHPGTVRRWIHQGKMQSVKLRANGEHRISEREIAAQLTPETPHTAA